MVSQIIDWRFAFDKHFHKYCSHVYAGCQYEGMNCALSVSLWPDCLRARPGHSIKRRNETPPYFHCRGNRCMPLHDSVLLLCMMTCPIPEMRCLPSRNLRTLTNAWCHVFVCFIIRCIHWSSYSCMYIRQVTRHLERACTVERHMSFGPNYPRVFWLKDNCF